MAKNGECMVCLDPIKEEAQGMFTAAADCNKDHDVCRDCLAKYVYDELDARRADYSTIPCPQPGCPNLYHSVDIIPRVLESLEAQHYWWRSVIQLSLTESMGFCPYVDCQTSFELASENEYEDCDDYAECPECERGICMLCGCIWHKDRTCHRTEHWRQASTRAVDAREKERRRERSMEVRRLARQENWTRCPQRQQMVARTDGCNTILCRCGTEFCYRCGSRSMGHICTIHCENLAPAALASIRQPMYRYPDDAAVAAAGDGNSRKPKT